MVEPKIPFGLAVMEQPTQRRRAERVQTARSCSPPPSARLLMLLCTGQFMVILDASIVNVALPSIRVDLGFSTTGLQWVVNGYTLAFASLLLLGGRLADRLGRRTATMTGLGLFAAASLLGGASVSSSMLIAARALQGVGAAVLSPATLTLLTDAYAGPARTRALAAWSSMAALGGVAGNVLGGALTTWLSWRSVLFVNVPISLVLVVSALSVLGRGRERRDRGQGRPDIVGGATVTAGLVLVTFGVVQSPQHGWVAAIVLGPVLAGIGVLLAFGWYEARIPARPMVPMRLFRSPTLSAGTVLMLLVGATSLSMWYFFSLFMQMCLHYGPLRTGLAMTPDAFAVVAGARTVRRYLSRLGARTLVLVGSLLGVAGFAWQAQATASSSYWPAMLGPELAISFGSGLVLTPVAALMTSAASAPDGGIVSGLVNAARQVGGSLGLTALVTIASSAPPANTTAHSAGVLARGYDRSFLAAAGLAAATAVVAAVVLPHRRPAAHPARPGTREQGGQ